MKRLNLFCAILFCGMLALATLTSVSGGIAGNSASGCPCHGPKNDSTVLTLTGMPAGGWVPGATYQLTAALSNAVKVKAGMSLRIEGGAISNLPPNTVLNADVEFWHTAPQLLAGGVASWTFSWTAPTEGDSMVINFSGNAVNDDNNFTGDAPNHRRQVFYAAGAAGVPATGVAHAGIRVYPSPAGHTLTVEDPNADITAVVLINAMGMAVDMPMRRYGQRWTLDVAGLPGGVYELRALARGVWIQTRVVKH